MHKILSHRGKNAVNGVHDDNASISFIVNGKDVKGNNFLFKSKLESIPYTVGQGQKFDRVVGFPLLRWGCQFLPARGRVTSPPPLPDFFRLQHSSTFKIQCSLDIQTSLRHQDRGCYRQRGLFINRLDIATWRPL